MFKEKEHHKLSRKKKKEKKDTEYEKQEFEKTFLKIFFWRNKDEKMFKENILEIVYETY